MDFNIKIAKGETTENQTLEEMNNNGEDFLEYYSMSMFLPKKYLVECQPLREGKSY